MSSQKRPRFIAALAGSALIIAGLMVPIGVAAEETPSGSVRPQAASSSTVGYWEAAQQIGGTGQIQSFAVAVASDDTVVVAGYFVGTAYFPTGPGDDSIALTSAGGWDIFVAALSADDSYFSWAQRAGGPINDQARSVAVTGDDTILVTGYLGPGTSYFPKGPTADDSIALTDGGLGDLFVAAMNADNSYFVWAQNTGGTQFTEANAVALSTDDSVLITGSFEGAANFPTGPSTSIVLNSAAGNNDVFVAAMNSDDSYFAWAQSVDGTGVLDKGTSIAVNSDGDIIVTGQFSDTANFPSGPGVALTLTSAGSFDIFVASLNLDDTYFTWAQGAGGTGLDQAWSTAVRGDDTVVLTGNFGGTAAFPTGPGTSASLTSAGGADIFVAALNKDDSYFSWAQGAGGVNDDVSRSVAVRGVSPLTITGYFSGTTYFPTGPGDDSISLMSAGAEDVFLATFNDDDTYFAWAQRAGSSTGSDRGYGVALRSDDTPMVTGYFNGTASFPSGPLSSIDLTSQGSSDGFIGWLSTQAAPGPSPTPDPPAPVTYPPSAPLDAAATAGDASATVTWTPPASSGSFPVTNYQATSSPGGKTCLVASPATSCTIDGLTNGTAYTFTVRALNGAGWSTNSAPSVRVIPSAPAVQTITLKHGKRIPACRTNCRGDQHDRITTKGSTIGLAEGTRLTAWVRYGKADFTPMKSTITVGAQGTFTWIAKRIPKGKKVTAYIAYQDLQSNRQVWDKIR